jgi:hypothetical protein
MPCYHAPYVHVRTLSVSIATQLTNAIPVGERPLPTTEQQHEPAAKSNCASRFQRSQLPPWRESAEPAAHNVQRAEPSRGSMIPRAALRAVRRRPSTLSSSRPVLTNDATSGGYGPSSGTGAALPRQFTPFAANDLRSNFQAGRHPPAPLTIFLHGRPRFLGRR